jgi:aspartate racemase
MPIVSLLEETLKEVSNQYPMLRKAGLLASTGTVRSRLFQELFIRKGIEILEPPDGEQKKVIEAIFGKKGIKAGFRTGFPARALRAVAGKLIRRGAQAIIAGCTEVPLVLKEGDLSVPFIEPMKIGALACIRKAGFKIR